LGSRIRINNTKPVPDPRQTEKTDPDAQQCKTPYPNPHLSEKPGAAEAYNEAKEAYSDLEG
jgi:hypothetical protein